MRTRWVLAGGGAGGRWRHARERAEPAERAILYTAAALRGCRLPAPPTRGAPASCRIERPPNEPPPPPLQEIVNVFRDMMGEDAGNLLPCIDALSNLCLSAELQSAVVEAALGRLQARCPRACAGRVCAGMCTWHARRPANALLR